jgi:hypothetical protein
LTVKIHNLEEAICGPSPDDVFFSPITPRSGTGRVAPSNTDANKILGTSPRPENFILATSKFWMYLYGLEPSTNKSVIEEFMKANFNYDSIRTAKPLPENCYLRTCDVSFKIGIPLNIKDRAMDPNSWS